MNLSRNDLVLDCKLLYNGSGLNLITSQVFCVFLAPFPELKAQRDDGNESGGKLNTSSNQVF